MIKLSKDAVLNTATLVGGLVGSYLVHSRNQLSDKPLSFWENEAWVAAFSFTGRVIGMALTKTK